MIKYKPVMVEHQEMTSFTCDRCKEVVTDDIELQETCSIRFCGEFGSVFGDGAEVGCDLCQRCLYELIKDFCVYEA